MRQPLHFWVVGGDPRCLALAQALVGDGHTVHTYALGPKAVCPSNTLNSIDNADCVILPLPAHSGELLNAPLASEPPVLEHVLDALAPGQLCCAGRVSPELERAAQARRLRLIDYFVREELAVANAVPTGEGAIQIAMEELPITLHGARVLLIGAGRLSRVLAQQLRGLSSKVTVAARRFSDLAWAEVWGCTAERTDELRGWMCSYDLVINTAPALLMGREELEDLKPGCLVIDLASAPGGVDFAAAEELGVKAIQALSLPGKVAPVTAALAIKAAIYNILTELGV